jgi:hypothetical protein
MAGQVMDRAQQIAEAGSKVIADTPQEGKNIYLIEPLLGQFEAWLKDRKLHIGKIPGMDTWIVTFDDDHPAMKEFRR